MPSRRGRAGQGSFPPQAGGKGQGSLAPPGCPPHLREPPPQPLPVVAGYVLGAGDEGLVQLVMPLGERPPDDPNCGAAAGKWVTGSGGRVGGWVGASKQHAMRNPGHQPCQPPTGNPEKGCNTLMCMTYREAPPSVSPTARTWVVAAVPQRVLVQRLHLLAVPHVLQHSLSCNTCNRVRHIGGAGGRGSMEHDTWLAAA